jgi:hypothetical protein
MHVVGKGARGQGFQQLVGARGSHSSRADEAVAVAVGQNPVSLRHVVEDLIAPVPGFGVEAGGDDLPIEVLLPPGRRCRQPDVEDVVFHS